MNGYYWASSAYAADNVYGSILRMSSGDVSLLVTGWQADAFSVRCVQAFVPDIDKME